jgi:hypothetical protein
MADSPYVIKNAGSQVVKGKGSDAAKGKSSVKSGNDLRANKK